MPSLPLPIGTYRYSDPSVSSRKLVNCTAEATNGKTPILVKRMPGIDSFAVAGTKLRGGHRFKGDWYVVSGLEFYKITDAGAVSLIGTVTGTKRVSIANNGFEMFIVSEPNGFVSDGTAITQITDAFYNIAGASDVDFIDGFFVFTRPDSQVMFNTELNSTTFNALDFTSIDGSPDNLVGLIVDHREIFVAGEKSCEFWYTPTSQTGIGSPFARSPSGYLEVGCASGQTLAKIDNTIFFLADDATVRRIVGNNPTVVSTPGISDLIRDQDISKAFGFAYTFEDKFYYTLTFETLTLEYDIAANEWHNRESRNENNWLPIDIVDDILALDSRSGNVGKLNSDTKTEWGALQLVQWTYQPIYSEGRLILHDRLELNISVGRGTTAESEIILFISDDGGSVFREYQRRSLGDLGERKTRVFWQNLGSSRNRVYQMKMSAPLDMMMFDTNVNVR